MFTYDDNTTLPLLKDLTKKFDAQNGTTTTVDSLPGSGAAVYPDKLKTELLGGSGPDVWRIWGGQIGAPFVRAKQAADLTSYYQKFGWDSKINTQAIAGMTFNGAKAGVPFLASGIGGWYSQAAFKKAGVSAPPTSYARPRSARAPAASTGARSSSGASVIAFSTSSALDAARRPAVTRRLSSSPTRMWPPSMSAVAARWNWPGYPTPAADHV